MAFLSRACIQDTLLAKRQGIAAQKGLVRILYDFNISTLRRGQLAPHVETAMRANRFLEKQAIKNAAPTIVVVIRGGLVQEVRSTNPYTQLFIADYDTDGCDASQLQQLKDAAERGNQPDMHVVY